MFKRPLLQVTLLLSLCSFDSVVPLQLNGMTIFHLCRASLNPSVPSDTAANKCMGIPLTVWILQAMQP
ncbi:hypothetical protein [Paenibacillus glucanolyticus]|uniref:hypothetical protein n=1 Tax=Paenibacillus glucanolyticus TaxID=59843 RepID=UPI0018D2F9F9|nr:hypothetical protein [Paenibacillus glucanolyticus]